MTALLLAAILPGVGCAPSGNRVDLIVRGGLLIDGTGAAPRRADVAIKHGRIHTIGDVEQLRATRVIDATDRIVAPGFIDMHSHADLILLADHERQEELLGAKIAQGVTTVIVGNCGLGAAPAGANSSRLLARINSWMTPLGVASRNMSVSDYLRTLEAGRTALNAGTLVAHGPLRISAMSLAAGAPTDEQLATMTGTLERELRGGALGLSTGLIYPPGMFSAPEELSALARVVARADGLYTSHVRGSSQTLLQATDELIEIARSTGVRAHHSHLEAVGRPYWEQVAAVLSLEDDARDEGLSLSHDVFPYTRAATMMSAIFPPWALEGGVRKLLERLAEPQTRQRIRDEIEHREPEWPPWQPGGWPHNLVQAVGWDGILISGVGPDGPEEWIGRSLADLGEALGRHPFDVVADLMIEEDGRVGQFVEEISGRGDEIDPLLAILAHPAGAIVSDAEDYGHGRPHPAHAGAFVRALVLARDRSLIPIEEVIRKMTSHPASLLKLDDRGRLEVGAAADLVVLDPGALEDRADWNEPSETASGVDWVAINGEIVVEDGRYVGGMHGQVLRATPR